MTNTHKHTHTPVDTAAAASTTTRTPSLGRFSGGSRQQIKHSVNHMTYWRLLQQIGVTIWRHYKRRQRRQRRRETRRNSDKTQHQQQHTPPLHTHAHTRNKLNWNSNKAWQIGGKRIVRGSWRLVAAVASFNAPTSPCCCFCWHFFLPPPVANFVWHYCSCKPAKSVSTTHEVHSMSWAVAKLNYRMPRKLRSALWKGF